MAEREGGAAIVLADAVPSDHTAALHLNAGVVPNVNWIPEATLAALHAQAFAFLVARAGGELAGFVLALCEDADYASPNFRWFQARYPRFVYVDRIVVDPHWRGAGVGRRLYAELEARARPRAPLVACEVNLRPPNPGSLAFHERSGFEEVGEQETEGGAKRVRMLVKLL
jgi:predicted GNAT superfamily acetyltransferase